jgi:aminopeptidase N
MFVQLPITIGESMKSFFLPVFFLVLILTACEQPPQNQLAMEKGVSWELAQFRKAAIADLRYDLMFELPAENSAAIPAQVKMAFNWAGGSKDLQIDFQADSSQLHTIEVNASAVEWSFEQEHIIIPHEVLQEGENQINIRFQAGDLSLNRNEDFLYTLLVPDRARTLFPCFDQPNLKAKFQLSLEVPNQWEALANGALEKEEIVDNRKLIRFQETAPISTYLFAFVAGEFQRAQKMVKGREMNMLFRESDQEKVDRNRDAIFELHAEAIEWMERYTDVPMPFTKFDFALIPGFQYGGMEHVGAIFYRESSLMLDENASESQRIGRASLIAHETAHMWFGDLVTMKWFDDVWLKEVFANFMAAMIVNPSFPEVNHELNFLLRHHPAAYGEDRSGGTHPIQQKLENLNEAGTLYGRIIYQKAPVVMRMLQEKLGYVGLRDGLRVYLRRFAYDNASWDDLIQILEERSDENLSAWSEAWVKRAGMPTFVVKRMVTEDSSTTGITYAQGEQDTVFREQILQPALIYTDHVIRDTFPLQKVDLKGQVARFPGLPLAVLSHAAPTTYGYFPLDEASKRWFLRHIGEVTDPVLRAGAWMSLYEDMLRGHLPTGDFYLTLLDQVSEEENTLIRDYLLGRIEEVYWRFFSAEERNQYNAETEKILSNLYQSLAKPGDAIACFRTYYAIAQSDEATAQLKAIWEQQQIRPSLPLTESESIDLIAELALRKTAEWEALVDQQLQRIKNDDRRRRLQYIKPALSAEAATRDAFFASLSHLENRATEPWTVAAVGYLHHPLRAPSALRYIEPSLELLLEIQATGDIFFPRQFITATLSGHNSQAAAEKVQQYLAEHPNYPPRLRRKVLMAADLLFRSARR